MLENPVIFDGYDSKLNEILNFSFVNEQQLFL